MREARVLAGKHFRRPRRPTNSPIRLYTLGMMGSFGHNKGLTTVKVRVHGRLAWFGPTLHYLLRYQGGRGGSGS